MTTALIDTPQEARLATDGPLRRRKVHPGDVLFHAGDAGDSAQLVLRGVVGLELRGRTREPIIARLARAGDVIAVNRLLVAGSSHEMTARALTTTEVHLIRWADIDDPDRQAHMWRWLGQRAAEETMALTERLAEIAHLPASVRVARAVERLCGPDDTVVTTQDVVAAVAGVVRVTANAELRTLSDRGIVTLSRRRLTIVDRDALARWSQ